jgi:hypothetical protein
MGVQKTVRRHAITLEHGAFQAHETVHFCKAGCRHPSGALVTRRAESLAGLVPSGGAFGYDVMVHVGLERYLQHRQREEIRASLLAEHGITISAGEVSTLEARFLLHLKALHEHCSDALRAALQSDGGWPLHVDATGEDGRGTLLVAFAGWRKWVLGAWKIPTERADAILPHLRAVVQRFGAPCAVMRDLGKAMIPAVNALVAEFDTPVRVLSCHQHFLADVGTDLLDAGHAELRNLFRRLRVRPGLRLLARELGRKLGDGIDKAREALRAWQKDPSKSYSLPKGQDGLAIVRGLAQWVLDFEADSAYRRFPFDRPYLDLYARCCQARRAADAFLRCRPEDRQVRQALERFCRLLDPAVTDKGCAAAAASIRMRASLFDELRDTLRLFPPISGPSSPPRQTFTAEQVIAELRDIRSDLETWVAAIRERRPERGPAQDERKAIDLVLNHLDRYGDSLWGHAIALPPEAGGGLRLVERTNQLEENFFRGMKHGERRRSGRKVLTQDFENLPPEAALALNLAHDDYVAILCGSIDKLPQVFAELDALRAELKRKAQPTAPSIATQLETQEVPLESASLSTADRRIIRSEDMNRRVEQAAMSRAPRTARKVG